MSEIVKDSHSFVGYEYKEVIANTKKASFLIDGFKNFGWIIDKNASLNMSENTPKPYSSVILHFKRDRKIMNKIELTRLQRNFEFCIREIDHLEKSITSKAIMYSLLVGISGTAFMAGAVFAITAKTPMIGLCIILAIPAFLGWIAPYFIYNNVLRKRTEKVGSLIEEKQDEVYELCKKGSKLKS